MTKIVLSLMVKNESKIIERCLRSALPHVDAVLICDTGSTDKTIQIARAHLGLEMKPFTIEEAQWQDFGHNRTLTLEATRFLVKQVQWILEDTFCLVLDADMELKCPAGALASYLT